jgi:nucleotide-binding universal stress UspA family protein
MIPWTKVACAVDLSEPCRVGMAADLARRLEAELTLVHVHPPLSPADTVDPASQRSRSLAAAEKALEAWRAEAETAVQAPVMSKVLFGDPAEELLRFAEEHGFALVIVGTHRRGVLGRVGLGSVAQRLIRESRCPVLVARDAGLLEKFGEKWQPHRSTAAARSAGPVS